MTKILCDLQDINQIIQETRNEWLEEVLSLLDIPEQIITLANSNVDLFRSEMEHLGIEIILFKNEEIGVYKKKWHQGVNENNSGWLPPTKDCMVAEWKRPTKVYVKEKGGVYCELKLNEWCSLRMLRKK